MVKKSELTKEWYKPIDLANMINVTSKTIINCCHDGRLTARVDNETGRHFIHRDEVIRFLKNKNLYEEDERYVAIYARGSDKSEQVERIERFCRQNNIFSYDIYEDKSISSRDAFLKLCKDVVNGKISKVYITRKDRLSRFDFKAVDLFFKQFGSYIVLIGDESKENIKVDYIDDAQELVRLAGGSPVQSNMFR